MIHRMRLGLRIALMVVMQQRLMRIAAQAHKSKFSLIPGEAIPYGANSSPLLGVHTANLLPAPNADCAPMS